jgi:hypothetical protein
MQDPNQLKSKHVAIEGNQSPQVGDPQDHLAETQRLDRVAWHGRLRLVSIGSAN